MNTITQLFNIKYPIIQGGMIWNSGYKLASAVSNAGGLGLLGSGSMYPHILQEQIDKCKAATNKPAIIGLLCEFNTEVKSSLKMNHNIKMVCGGPLIKYLTPQNRINTLSMFQSNKPSQSGI